MTSAGITSRSQSHHECSCGLPFNLLLQRPLHTWYVGAQTRLATSGGFTEPRVPPTCRRPASRLRAFSGGYRVASRLVVGPHQKARSRLASFYRHCPTTRWGDGFKRCPIGHTRPGRLRKNCGATSFKGATFGCRKKRRRKISPHNRPPPNRRIANRKSQIANRIPFLCSFRRRPLPIIPPIAVKVAPRCSALLTAGGASRVRASYERNRTKVEIINN